MELFVIPQLFLLYVEIKNYGHDDQKKKLIAGIVLTGGGSQLKHLKQLVEYITGMDTRIGYPNEHLAGDSDEEIASHIAKSCFKTNDRFLMNYQIVNGDNDRFKQIDLKNWFNELKEQDNYYLKEEVSNV